ncbi:HFL245Cp [Eremothecium sinecaudum]|uniref:DNA repair and recombination protein RAD52 n=1 Tax=Eremothecium sinecaudum TaxID=45286 RepID=A0A0X8HTM7_9SACH|nr:HFL245Cp [Eremothecium sinecaudum]AMD21611.1 HFL245Cp [Eremothecium sinecaudum]
MAEKRQGPLVNSDDIQAKLDKRLGPEYISKRVGHGSTRVAYIEGWKAINLANQIFGYNGWSSEVKNVTIDFMDEKQGRFTVGCTAIVRVTLSDGSYREDIGYGTVDNERRKPAAFERAKKSAVTDALKRSLRGFGNALGNCLYDKDFLSRIDKVKFEPPDFDEDNLFRVTDELSEVTRSNTVPEHYEGPIVKKRSILHPAESDTPALPNDKQRDARVSGNIMATRLRPASSELQHTVAENDQEDLLDDSFMFSDELQDDDLINIGHAKNASNAAKNPAVQFTPDIAARNNVPVAFVTAKAAPSLQNKKPVPTGQIFNPKFQAQSIKHTVDQSTSTHVKLSILREKGIDQSRDAIYAKFAPKGKIIDNPDTPTTPLAESNNGTVANKATPLPSNQQENITNNSSATKSSLTEAPNSPYVTAAQLAKMPTQIQRREVGRPKVNHPNLRKPSIP